MLDFVKDVNADQDGYLRLAILWITTATISSLIMHKPVQKDIQIFSIFYLDIFTIF